MTRIALPVCLLLALTVAAVAGEPETKPLPEQPLHFRLEVGVRPGHVVAGRLEESKGPGKGYDLALLDLDGDGVFETKQAAGTQQDYATKAMVPKPTITVEHEGARWVLDLYSLGRVRPAIGGDSVVTYVRWSVTTEALYAWFINGRVTLHTDAAKAKAADPIRLGPPFKFDTGSSMRGPDALVRVGLKDGLGCTMRLARSGSDQRNIKVQLRAGEKTLVDTHAKYG